MARMGRIPTVHEGALMYQSDEDEGNESTSEDRR